MERKKIFFSYSRVDGEVFALRLARDLSRAGAPVWIDQLNIELGKPWDQEIENALQTAECVLFIATEKSTTSNNVLNEISYALDENKKVIPAIFHKCRMPFLLRRLQHIDFTADYDTAFERLLVALKLEKTTLATPDPPDVSEAENQETLFWKEVIAKNEAALFEEYLRSYPQGQFRDTAVQKLNELSKAQRRPTVQNETAPAAPAVPEVQGTESTAPVSESDPLAEEKATSLLSKRNVWWGVGIAATVAALLFLTVFNAPTNRASEGGIATADSINSTKLYTGNNFSNSTYANEMDARSLDGATHELPAGTNAGDSKAESSNRGDSTIGKRKPSKKTATATKGDKLYNGFADAFPAVFQEAKTNFSNIKGDPFSNNTADVQNYKPGVTIKDSWVTAANIFRATDRWAMRFVVNGSEDEEEARYRNIKSVIQGAFREQGLPFLVTEIPYGKGTKNVPSFQYEGGGYQVAFYRIIDNGQFHHEIIIYSHISK